MASHQSHHIWYNRFMITLLNYDARHYLLYRQMLLYPQSLQGNSAVEKVFNTLRIIQYDPLNPCGRNVDLVLQARINDYHPDGYIQWLYEERKGIECYDKELCIIPIEDFPLTHHNRIKAQGRRKAFLKRYRTEIEDLMKQIETKGPVTSADVSVKKRVRGDWSDTATFGRMALEILWKVGRLVVVGRVNGRKVYDLPHRVYGTAHTADTNKSVEYEHVLRRVRAVGLLPVTGSGGGWQGMSGSRITASVIRTLVSKDILTEVSVSGSRRVYVAATDQLSSFATTMRSDHKKQMTFIAPLDTFMWDRDTIEDLFGFKYRWEVYTPVNKRQYGYYVLPVLYGDQLVGRIEPTLQNQTLVVRGLWKESSWPASKEPLEQALVRFRNYLQAREIRIERTSSGI